MDERQLEWRGFVAAIAEVAGKPADSIDRSTRLLDDLGLDSFTLSELVALLLIDLRMRTLERDLTKRDWRMVTVGELFAEYGTGRAPARGDEYVIRKRQQR